MLSGRRSLAFLALPLALLTACATTPAGSGTTAPAPVAIATTTQLGSLLSDITKCAGATSATLMGPGDDPHDFSVSSREVATLTKARLVVASGLGLEGGLKTTLDAAQADGARVFEVGPRLDPLSYASLAAERTTKHTAHDHDHEHEHEHEHASSKEPAGHNHDHASAKKPAGHNHDHASAKKPADHNHSHGEFDPHVHMDAARMSKAAALIGAELAQATGDDRYQGCGMQVSENLKQVDAQVREILSTVPADRRMLVTDHEAYNYFAKAYGFKVAGVVVPGGGTDSAPSSAELAKLVEVIKQEKVTAIFSNNSVNPRLVEAVSREAGTPIRVVELYEGSVGPTGSGAETYSGMMLTNARRIADALK